MVEENATDSVKPQNLKEAEENADMAPDDAQG